MQRLLSTLALIAGLLCAPAALAAEVKLPFGSFVAPDGVTVVNREEKPDKAGKPAGMPALVGGVEGGRYEGLLPTGQRAVSYVAVKGGYRLVALLKAPPTSPYKELTDQFAKGVEDFAWRLPAQAAASASQ